MYLAAGGGGDDASPVALVGLLDPETAILPLLLITGEDLVALAARLVAGGGGRVDVAGADGLGLVAHVGRSLDSALS